jgi:hypothetical protein
MPFDEHLAERLRDLFGINPEISERKMFGGLAFMHRGHMCCGIIDHELMVRVGPDAYGPMLGEAHTRPMDFTGRPLTGMVMVDPAGVAGPKALGAWVDRGIAFTDSLPPKKPSKPKPRKRLKTASKRTT